MNPIHNPFTRDAYPALTDAINGVVNESHTRAQLEKKSTTELRALRKTHASKGAKADSRSAETLAHIHGILRSRGAGHALDEAAVPQGGGKKPFNPFNPTMGDLLRSKAQDKKAPKPKPVKEDIQTPSRERQMSKQIGKHTKTFMSAMNNYQIQVHKGPKATDAAEKKWTAATDKLTATQAKDADEKRSRKTYGTGGKVVREAVTAAQQKVFARERERMLNALNNPKQKLSPTEREAVLARGARNAAAETRKGAVSPTGEKSPIYSAAKAHHEYARRESKKLDAIAKRKVQEAAQLDERIIDEVDFFQASKNLLTGKGFKTNREVSGARVNANMAAMQRRKARAAKTAKKTK